jgi:hypothetical protein
MKRDATWTQERTPIIEEDVMNDKLFAQATTTTTTTTGPQKNDTPVEPDCCVVPTGGGSGDPGPGGTPGA